VRLKGIDAPEYDQPFGNRAREALGRLCEGQPARVWTTGRDAYDRLLGDLYCGDVWINGQMVASGHAWHYRRGQQAPVLDQLERDARQAGEGLWSQRQPIAPWEHRSHSARSQVPSKTPATANHPSVRP
jgi:endonuclease YncB( thermonuclease family)